MGKTELEALSGKDNEYVETADKLIQVIHQTEHLRVNVYIYIFDSLFSVVLISKMMIYYRKCEHHGTTSGGVTCFTGCTTVVVF